MSQLIDKSIGKYNIVGLLGRGGMAEVLKGYHPGLKQDVAIKLMHQHLSFDTDFVSRFKQEARAVASLRHPNIVQMLDFDETDGQYYMVMEFIDGVTLKDELKERNKKHLPLKLEEIGCILSSLGEALDYAHGNDMIHRDVKPANVMINSSGQVVLADFGITRLLNSTQKHTATGASIGTPAYMSPEQAKGKGVKGTSDLYSLGIILYEMVTGQVPFEGDTTFAVMFKHVTDAPPHPHEINPDISDEVVQVILKALSKDPKERYQTGAKMAQAFWRAIKLTEPRLRRVVPFARPDVVKPLATEDDLTLPPTGVPSTSGPDVTQPPTGVPSTSQPDAIQQPTDVPSTTSPVSSTPSTPQPSKVVPETPPSTTKRQPILIGAFILIVIVLIVGGIGFLIYQSQQTEQTQQQAIVEATQVAATQTAAINQAGEATKVWLNEDDDRDGLTNGEEEARNTLVDKRDTDEDGLEDGEEVNTRKTDPLKPDTDGDGLKDGEEIRMGIDPLKDDTDGDGVLDNVDPDPGSAPTDTPTATPSQTSTPSFTFTPVPSSTSTVIETPTATPTPEKQLTGKIAFPLKQGNTFKVYVVEVSETVSDIPYASLSHARHPALSPDGSLLLVDGTNSASSNVIMRFRSNGLAGMDVTCPNITAVSGRPSWSPDGSRFIFDGLDVDPSNPQIYFHTFEEQDCNLGDNRFTINGGFVTDSNGLFPLWGYDGLVYFKGCSTWDVTNSGNCGIWSASENGIGLTQITTATQHYPTDVGGSHVLYMARPVGAWNVYKVSKQGGIPINLTPSDGSHNVWAVFSPDEQTIAFMSSRGGKWAIWMMDTDGSNARSWMTVNFDWGEVDPNDLFGERMSWSR